MRPGFSCIDQGLQIGLGPDETRRQSERFTKCGPLVSSCPHQTAPGETAFYAKRCFIEADQGDLGRPVPFAKIFLFPSDPNHLFISSHPGPPRGAFRDRHGREVGMRWTRAAPKTRALIRGRRSRVVLTPRRWRQVRDDASHHTDDGGKKARSPGRARSSR